MTRDIAQTTDYQAFITTLKQKIRSDQLQAAGWGDAINGLGCQGPDVGSGGLKGLSRANLYDFYGFYGADKSVAQLVLPISRVRLGERASP